MGKAGRPNKYETHIKPHLEDIREAFKRGVDEKDIAESVGVSISSWCDYKNKYSEFAEVLKRDTEDTKAILKRLDNALLKSAEGFYYTEEKSIGRRDNKGENIVLVEKHTKYQPPNATAIFGAYNRFDKDYVKDRAYYDLKTQELELKKAIAEASNFDLFLDNEKGE